MSNLRILDLGCGDAIFGRESLAKGCKSYLGVEGSINMVKLARENLAGTTAKVDHARIEDWDFPNGAVDFVISRLVLHYIEDVDTVFRRVYQALTIGGKFIFSVEHPVITSSDAGWRGVGKRQDWLVDNYFSSGQRVTNWMGGQVIKYHRTVENYFVSLQRAGFVVEALREAEPQHNYFGNADEEFQRRKRIPLFLILAACKA